MSQPAFKVMKKQGYGRFVFISSSGGMFGQHLEAHYGAAKAGLVGLSNVIALEGADHGILSNTVLPFGVSRMVTETVDPDTLRSIGLLDLISPDKVVPIVTYLAAWTLTLEQSFGDVYGGSCPLQFLQTVGLTSHFGWHGRSLR